jgi:hypothetical protein
MSPDRPDPGGSLPVLGFDPLGGPGAVDALAGGCRFDAVGRIGDQADLQYVSDRCRHQVA